MLVLGRNPGETIRIGNNIVIHVLQHRGKQIRIGIDAPPHISVHREEIYQKINKNEDTLGFIINNDKI